MFREHLSRMFTAFFLWVMAAFCLMPLPFVTDTSDLRPFLWFVTAFCISQVVAHLGWLRRLPGLSFFLTGAALVRMMSRYYFPGWPFFEVGWWVRAWEDLWMNLPMLFERHVWWMSSFSRTFFFMLGLWAFLALVWYYLYRRRWIFWFLVVTLVYLAGMDTFTDFDGKLPVMVSLGLGLWMMAWMRLARMGGGKWFRVRWVAGSLAVVLAATNVAYAVPKPGPVWPDPVPWMVQRGAEVAQEEVSGWAYRKVGYGYNDAQLGGTFLFDDTVVFHAQTTGKAYWRGESKAFYTGQGWFGLKNEKNGSSLALPVGRPFDEEIPDSYKLFDPEAFAEVKTIFQEVTFNKETVPKGMNGYPVFHQGMLEEVSSYTTPKGALAGDVLLAKEDGAGFYQDQGMPVKAVLRSAIPVYDLEALRAASSAYPQEIQDKYLQLPENLPVSVRRLSQELVSKENNPYDAAKAIESYLHSAAFTYEEEVPMPDPDQDFVAQFLFETKEGYCDYFSTSMVVLLRAAGIPARWVKGFTSGDLSLKVEDGDRTYEGEVRTRNAHSWPEVYFPGTGWVPFEPTKGFQMPMEVQIGEVEAGLPVSAETDELQTEEAPPPQEQPAVPPYFGAGGSWSGAGFAGGLLAAVTFAIMAAAVFWFFRHRFWFFLHFHLKQGVTAGMYEEAYERLLKMLDHRIKRRPDETVREYALRYASQGGSYGQVAAALLDYTRLYEEVRYGGKARAEILPISLRDMWRACAPRKGKPSHNIPI